MGTSHLTAKTNKLLETNKLVNVPTGLNNLKTKVDDLDVNQLKTIPLIRKKLSDLVNYEVAKYGKFHTLRRKTQLNKLDKKIPDENT